MGSVPGLTLEQFTSRIAGQEREIVNKFCEAFVSDKCLQGMPPKECFSKYVFHTQNVTDHDGFHMKYWFSEKKEDYEKEVQKVEQPIPKKSNKEKIELLMKIYEEIGEILERSEGEISWLASCCTRRKESAKEWVNFLYKTIHFNLIDNSSIERIVYNSNKWLQDTLDNGIISKDREDKFQNLIESVQTLCESNPQD